jgi:hypothetical protein
LGFPRSVLSLMGVNLEAPDHTTLSRRSQHLDVALHPTSTNTPIHLIVVSTGLSIVGEGEWAAAKHGGRGKRAWKKLHIGVDRSGLIVAEALTHGKESGHHRQARVENRFFRYKSIIGDKLRARNLESQNAEAIIACNVLNTMIALGRPKSFAIQA